MPTINSQDYATRLLRNLDQVAEIPQAQRLEVLQVLIGYARSIRSMPLPGELRGRLGVHAMDAIFAIAESDPASARALRALAARVVDERAMGVARPGISSSMPWPNPLDVRRSGTDARRDGGSATRSDDDRYRDDAQRRADEQGRYADEQNRYADEQSRYADEQRRYADEQRRRMYDEQRRRMLEDDRRRMFEDAERRRRDAERYR
jgi:hypothetical protein